MQQRDGTAERFRPFLRFKRHEETLSAIHDVRELPESGLGSWPASSRPSHRRVDGVRGHRRGRPESQGRETRERVDLRVVCGACRRADTSFPISLVPVAKAPPPHPCRVKLKGHMETGLCSPTAARPPSERPFVLLGGTDRGRRALPAGSWPPGSNSDLRFAVPEIEPGRYAFVIFCAECGRRSRGSLIADTSLPRKNFLRIQPSEASVRTAGGGADPTWSSSQVSGPSRWCSRPACCSVGGKQYEH